MIDDNTTTKTSLLNSPGSPVHAIKIGLESSIVQLINQSNRCVYPAYQYFQFNSLFTQNTSSDHWYMRYYNLIIYKLHWFTGEGHKKGEAKCNKCKKRKNKYNVHAKVVKKIVRKNIHCL